MNLAQVSSITSDRGRALLAILLAESPYLRYLDRQSAFEEDATDFTYRTIDAPDQVKTRLINGSYASTVLAPGTPIPGTLAIHGDQLDVDATYLADARRGLRDLDEWLDKTLRKKGRGYARGLDAKLVKGDPGASAGDVKGLFTMLDGTDFPGFAGVTGVIDAGTWPGAAAGVFTLTEANSGTFFEQLNLAISQVPGANGLLGFPTLMARVNSYALDKRLARQTNDQLGIPITQYGRVDLVEMLADSAPVEAGGTQSLIIARAGEGEFDYATNSGLEFYDRGEVAENQLDEKPSERIRYEVRTQPRVHEKDVLRRIKNLKLN